MSASFLHQDVMAYLAISSVILMTFYHFLGFIEKAEHDGQIKNHR